jgi:cell division septation protein DedD
MQQHGFDAYTVVVPHFTLVRIGSYSDRVAAAQAAAQVQAATRVSALILRTTGP